MSDSLTDQPILSIGQVSLLLKKSVETQFSSVRLRGEISGAKKHTSGHWYLTLKDQDAVIDAVCWKGTSLCFAPSDGLEVIAHGRITTYPARSKYQMVITSLQPFGEGALLKLLLERKERLKAEGLFDQKRPLPVFPKHIGVITSPTGAVLHDILHRIKERYPCCTVTVWPVLVQGDGAVSQITQAIAGFNAQGAKPDVLIIARGGGSLEDLWAFNEEEVVRATARSVIPTISAIGHETDTTLIDFASDVRAPTPTAAAEIATPVMKTLLSTLETLGNRFLFSARRNLQNQSLRLQRYALSDPSRVLEPLWLRLDDWTDRLNALSFLRRLKDQLRQTTLRCPRLDLFETKIALMQHALTSWSKMFVQTHLQRLEVLNLLHLSPKRSLDRGFCFVESEGHVIDSVSKIKPLQEITLTFSDGYAKAIIKS